MSTLWNRSGTIERYADDLRAANAKAYFYEGGTTTPLIVFQNSGDSIAHPWPVAADADGRWPDIFVPFITSYDVQVKTVDNVQLTYTAEIPNADPVTPIPVVDTNQLIQTGAIHCELVNVSRTGFVRLNGKTMGNAASGATERANDDTVTLFSYLWTNMSDTVAPVSGGRGLSAASDFAANKTITLPDLRGGVPTGLDDMGAAAGSFFTGLTFGLGSAILPGSSVGANSLFLTVGQLPVGIGGTTDPESAHTHTGNTDGQSNTHTHSGTSDQEATFHTHDFSGTTGTESVGHTHTVIDAFQIVAAVSAGGGAGAGGTTVSEATGTESATHTHTYSGTTINQSLLHTHAFVTGIESLDHTHAFVSNPGAAHSHDFTVSGTAGARVANLPRSILVTWYIKL